jgi:hypothetical protein
MKRILRNLWLGVIVLSPVVAQNPNPSTPDSLIADLNGDGVRDTIVFSTKQDEYDVYTEYTITVNRRSVSFPVRDVYEMECAVVDIDKRDRVKEIAVTSTGTDDFTENMMFVLDSSGVHSAPPLTGMVEYRGDGVVAAAKWMGFWSIVEEYQWDRNGFGWRPMPRDTYDVGVTVTALKGFQLHETRDDDSKVTATVKPRNRFDIVSCDPSPVCEGRDSDNDNGDCDWYMIRLQNGTTGWVRLRDFKAKARIPWAG